MSAGTSSRTHALRAVLASALLVTLIGFVLPSATGAPQDTVDPVETATGAFEVRDAVFAWGLNDESNNKSFAPGTFNFLSAGLVPDPGSGGQAIVAPGVWRGTSTTAWRARAGKAEVQKRGPDGTYAKATFGGLSTGPDGTLLTSTSGPFSQHRIVLSGGSGTIDPEAGTARIDWTGSFSVVYYSGFTFFTITDPTLTVGPGRAQVRATVAGYAADRDDASQWAAVAPRRVVLADLPSDLVVPAEVGFTAQPAYRGVTYAGTGGTQVRSGDAWGAFPASFLSYMDRVGASAFWYSSGGSADPHKVPHQLSVSYDSTTPVEPSPTETTPPGSSSPPSPTTTLNPTPPATPEPSTVPSSGPTTTPTGTVTVTVAPAPPAPSLPPPPVVPLEDTGQPSAAPVYQLAAVPTAYSDLASSDPAAGSPAPPGPSWPWWVGAFLLLTTIATHRITPSKGKS